MTPDAIRDVTDPQRLRVLRIPLTLGVFTVVDEEDAALAERRWFARRSRATFYAVRNIADLRNPRKQTVETLHRVIVGAPPGTLVDHVDGNGLNNRRSNLRIATPKDNVHNSGLRKSNKSGFKGVCWAKEVAKWRADVGGGADRRYLGVFATAEEAARAYDVAARKLYGEFAWLNFPKEQP